MMTPESPFYLGVAVPLHNSSQQPWFKPLALGVNKLNDLVRMIRDITGTVSNGSPYHYGAKCESRFQDDDASSLDNDVSAKSSPQEKTSDTDAKLYRSSLEACDSVSDISMQDSSEKQCQGNLLTVDTKLSEDRTDQVTALEGLLIYFTITSTILFNINRNTWVKVRNSEKPEILKFCPFI
jgi:hypothetical protein